MIVSQMLFYMERNILAVITPILYHDASASYKMHYGNTTFEGRGGWTRFKRFVNILHLTTFFCWVVHVTFNNRNALLKKPWGSVGFTRYSDCASSQDHGDVVCFVKSLDFWGEIKEKRFNAHNFTRLVTYRFSITKQRYLTALY